MIIYILKIILSSGLLLLIYFLFLEKEKMLHFNRFYLLFSIAFSLVIPFFTINFESTQIPIAETLDWTDESFLTNNSLQTIGEDKRQSLLPDLLLVCYIFITSFFLYRFISNIGAFSSKIKTNKLIPYFHAKLVLTKNKLVPHSFLNYIFINQVDFEKGNIEKEILLHELTHVKQKHSLDILLLELLLISFWFNPFFYLYRKAIQLNHEFLADETVIKTFKNTSAYQHLLLAKIGQASGLSLSSQFNYSTTKKRLIMISKNKSPKNAICKQLALIPLLAGTVFLFSTKTVAQDTTKIENKQQIDKSSNLPALIGKSPGNTKEGVTQELLKEYESIIEKYNTNDEKWPHNFNQKITVSERERLETIFKQMSKEQQKKQMVFFMKNPGPSQKNVPTKDQLESWKNPKMYGVWIDDKRVSNSVLNKYSNTDFAYFVVSKLAKNTINYGKHYYQVNLMTKAHYQDYYDKTIANKENLMVVKWINKKGGN